MSELGFLRQYPEEFKLLEPLFKHQHLFAAVFNSTILKVNKGIFTTASQMGFSNSSSLLAF
jgi:hypothetical protein